MAYVKLSRAMRAHAIAELTRQLARNVDDKRKEMVNFKSMGERVFKAFGLDTIEDEVLKLERKLGKAIGARTRTIRTVVVSHERALVTVDYAFDETHILPYDRGNFGQTFIGAELAPSTPGFEDFFEAVEAFVAAEKNKAILLAEATALLGSAQDVGELLKVWPSAADFLPSEAMERFNAPATKRAKREKPELAVSNEFKVGLIATRLTTK